MVTLEDVNQVEEQDAVGAPTLGEALRLLTIRWQEGERDEGTALRLLFLLWYREVEPPWLTGLYDVTVPLSFVSVFNQAGGEDKASPMILLAVGAMASMFGYGIDGYEQEANWEGKSEELIRKALKLQPYLSALTFVGFGEAGKYFRHILKGNRIGYATNWIPTTSEGGILKSA